MTEIWKHWPEYGEARRKVETQSYDDDLQLLDSLFGRDKLKFGDGPTEVKKEALRQLEIEFRSERNELAEFHVNVIKASM